MHGPMHTALGEIAFLCTKHLDVADVPNKRTIDYDTNMLKFTGPGVAQLVSPSSIYAF